MKKKLAFIAAAPHVSLSLSLHSPKGKFDIMCTKIIEIRKLSYRILLVTPSLTDTAWFAPMTRIWVAPIACCCWCWHSRSAARRRATCLPRGAASTIGVRAHPLLPAKMLFSVPDCARGDRPGAAEGRPSRTSSCYCAKSPRPPARTVSARALRRGLATIFFGGGTPSLLPPRGSISACRARRGVRPRAGRGGSRRRWTRARSTTRASALSSRQA